MKNQKICKFKWVWGWEDEKEEAWLRSMAGEGLHLLSVDGPGFYSFIPGPPADVVYRLDYRNQSKKQLEEYLQLFTDAGWEYIGEMGGWQYFRQPARPGRELEILSDPQSKIEKYQRLLALFSTIAPALFLFMMLADELPVTLGFLVVDSLLAFAMLKLYRRISQLKRL